MLTDEHAIGEPGTHRRRGEGQAQSGDRRSQAVIRTDRRGDLLRILRPHARVHILAPIAVGPAVESTFTDGCEIVWNKVRAEFVAFVHHGPYLTRSGLDRAARGLSESRSIGHVRATLEERRAGKGCHTQGKYR